MPELTERQIFQAIKVLREKYAAGLLSRKEFLRLVAELTARRTELNEALKKRTGTYPNTWEEGGIRTKKARTSAMGERYREMRKPARYRFKPPNFQALLRGGGRLGGLGGILLGLTAGKYPEEYEISEELEKIKGQEDESRRRATERAWLMNLFGLLQEDLSPEEKEEVLKEIDIILVKADGLD